MPERKTRSRSEPRRCSNCRRPGHNIRTCPELERSVRHCSVCNKTDHDKRTCPELERRVRHCSICNKTDHDRRTCPKRDVVDLLESLVIKPRPTVRAVFNKGKKIPGMDPNRYRMDVCGNILDFHQYGYPHFQWEIDHIVPKARGGSNDLSNLQPLLWEENRAKGCKDPRKWCRCKNGNIPNWSSSSIIYTNDYNDHDDDDYYYYYYYDYSDNDDNDNYYYHNYDNYWRIAYGAY